MNLMTVIAELEPDEYWDEFWDIYDMRGKHYKEEE